MLAHRIRLTGRVPVTSAVTLYDATSDGFLNSSNATYSVAAAGTGTFTVDTTATNVACYGDTVYNLYESFVSFDLSSIPAGAVLNSAAMAFGLIQAPNSANPVTMEVRKYNWGGSLSSANWRTPAQLTALNLACSRLFTSTDPVGGARYTLTNGTLLADLTPGVVNYFVFNASGLRSGTAPTGVEVVNFYSANFSGNTDAPSLAVNYTY